MTNPNRISQMTTSGWSSVQDNTDAIHSGVVKSLNQMASGNMVIEGCNVTQTLSGTSTRFDVANGKYLRDGALVSFSADNKQLNTTTNEFTGSTGVQVPSLTSGYDFYCILVLDSAGALQIRGDQSIITALTPKVAALSNADTPICIIQIAGATANDAARAIQYVTVDKPSNSISIAKDNSGTYTETASITAPDTTTALITAASGADVKVKLAGTAAGDTFEVIDSAAEIQFKVQGNGVVSTQNDLSVGGSLGVLGGTIQVTAANDAVAALLLQADNSDDAGDDWKFIANADQTLTVCNDKASAGAYVPFLTITPHATPASSNVAIAGDLTITGGNITNNLTLDGSLTLNNGATIVNTSAALLTITEATTAFSAAVTAGSSIAATTTVAAGSTVTGPTGIISAGYNIIGSASIDVQGGAGATQLSGLGAAQKRLYYLHNCGGANLELPVATSSEGMIITLKSVDPLGDVVIIPNGGDLIDGGVNCAPAGGTPPNVPSAARAVGVAGAIPALIEPYWAFKAPNQIVLKPYMSITLHAVTDSLAPLVTGWYILE